jgi:membrane protein implicated in regulation of membrane protease activity
VLDFIPRWILVWSIPLLFAATIVLGGVLSLLGLPPEWAIIAIAIVVFPGVPLAIIWHRRIHGLERGDDGVPAGRLDGLLGQRAQRGMPTGRLDSWLSKRE